MKSGGLFLALVELKYGFSSLIERTGGSSSNLKEKQGATFTSICIQNFVISEKTKMVSEHMRRYSKLYIV
jgi:hypothetical protein